MEHLLDAFVHSAAEAGATAPVADVEGAGMDLLRRWAEPHRAYHDVRHLSEVLRRLDDLAEDGAEAGPAAALAAWFHDAVHTGSPGEDEQSSAELAVAELAALGVPHETARRVGRLVLVTTDHRPPAGDDEAAALCDADLAVLASGRDRYEEYTTDVRREYARLDDATFASGRAAVLRDLLDRPRLFTTAAGQERWEAAARENVLRELAGLSPPTGG